MGIKKLPRMDWDEFFLLQAEVYALRSTCDKAHVGCIIVKNNIPVGLGYNGSISGHPHCDDVGHLLSEDGRCIRTLHAEQNALLNAIRDPRGGTAYVTHEPCDICTKMLNQKGIKRVVFRRKYKSERSLPFRAGMEWVHFDKPLRYKIVPVELDNFSD